MLNYLDFQQNIQTQKKMEELLRQGCLTALEDLLDFQDDIISELKADKPDAVE